MAVDFVDAGHDLEPIPEPGVMAQLLKQSATLINAIVILVVTGVVILFVVRPLIRLLAPSTGGDIAMMDDDPI